MRVGQVWKVGLLASVLVLVGGATQAENAASQAAATSKLQATYDMSLGLFDLGNFRLTVNFDGPQYTMQAKAKFEILKGLIYRGDGTTRSAGVLTDDGPEPSVFEVSYKGGDKKEKRFMRFTDGAVSEFSIVPAKKPNPHNIPLNEDQLVNVLDPLSAAFLSIRSDLPPGDPKLCRKTVRVFDGQQRFDVVLSPKRTDKLLKGAPSTMPARVAVCRVKYVPVSGYRPDNRGVKFMTKTNDVEVWLASVPQEHLYLPYRIVVPTALGSGSATLTKVKIQSPE
jgi:hypothetical protein